MCEAISNSMECPFWLVLFVAMNIFRVVELYNVTELKCEWKRCLYRWKGRRACMPMAVCMCVCVFVGYIVHVSNWDRHTHICRMAHVYMKRFIVWARSRIRSEQIKPECTIWTHSYLHTATCLLILRELTIFLCRLCVFCCCWYLSIIDVWPMLWR